MQFGHKLLSSQQKFVDDFIHFKLIIPDVIKSVQNYLIDFLFFTEHNLIEALIFFV